MDFTFRQIKLLQLLDQSDVPLSGKQLSEALDVSLRTVQNEVRDINHGDFGRLILSDGHGYSINRAVMKDRSILVRQSRALEMDSDLTALLKLLTLDHASIHFDTLCDQLYLSSSAANRKLKKLDEILQKYHLSLSKKRNYISIQGNENNKRQLIYDMIVRETDANFNSPDAIGKYFTDLNFTRIQDIVVQAIHRHNYYLEPCHTSNLIINLMVCLSRIRNHFPTEYPELNIHPDSTEYQIAEEICEKLGEHWSFLFGSEDISFIGVLIAGHIKAVCPAPSQEDHEHQLFFIEKIILETFNYYRLDFHDPSFLNNFVYHIMALIRRARNSQYVTNLVSENVRELNPFIYDVSVHLAHTLEKEFHINVIEDEINLLSIYIGLMIRPSFGRDYVRVLLICEEYHHIAEYLSRRLQTDFAEKLQIVDVLTSIPSNLSTQNIDLIIHTIPLHILGAQTLLISPFYQKSDSLAVENRLDRILLEHQNLQYRSLLLTYFNQALFFRNEGIRTKEEAIRFLGHHLEHMGICRQGFTESVMHREALASTCFFESFAVPHAIELDAKFTQFCVLIEEEGILWDDAKISCVFMIAVNEADNDKFSTIYGGLVDLLCDKTALGQIIEARDFAAFISCFE